MATARSSKDKGNSKDKGKESGKHKGKDQKGFVLFDLVRASTCAMTSIFSKVCMLLSLANEFVAEPSAHYDVDVLIVGGGQAGMAAAHRLASLGHSVHVLEATDHVGGRTRNFDVGSFQYDTSSDDVMEVGGTWLSTKHTAALTLCKDLNLSVYNASFLSEGYDKQDTPDMEWPWWYWGMDGYPKDQASQIKDMVFHGYAGRFVYRDPSTLLDGLNESFTQQGLDRAGSFLDSASKAVSDSCWNVTGVSSVWRQFDADSSAGVLNGYLKSKEAKQILRNVIHGKNAQEPEAVSFLYNLLSFKGCNSQGTDERFRVRGGSQAIPLAIAARMQSNITFGAVVRTIHSKPDGVQISTDNGKKLLAKVAIVTGPPAVLLGIQFVPPLSGIQAQLLQRMPMGTSLKFAAVYKQGPWWRALGYQGDILATKLPADLSLEGVDSEIPLFVQCVDHSPFSSRLGVLACFLEGRQNLYFTQLPRERQETIFLRFLRLSFNDARAETYKPKFVSHNWADQPFARGAYSNFFTTGVMSVPEFWEAYRQKEKLPNVFVAGSDYHAGYGNGYIEGAIRDGQLAADRAAEKLQRKLRGGENEYGFDVSRPRSWQEDIVV
eukprot:TRINITY_DN11952_c0_g1_i1.p1 TRINITY_DN11952_c0_g1~~TRINITY_DN11952_c0_g1_i1.p1  ORF type:complete len:605 (-),score=87.61 TRINITY_DN11952_c0_g1_i1:78-1892(-)